MELHGAFSNDMDSPPATSLKALLEAMHCLQASDLILTAGSPPQCRINGQLRAMDRPALRAEDTRALVRATLTPDRLARLERDRSLDLSLGIEGLSRFRVNIFYQRDALSVAVRMIPFHIPSFETLGLPDIAREFAERPHGLVLVTGPAGSGKSTTLAAMIDHINTTRGAHVICIEDPIEYLHTHRLSVIEQREVEVDTPSFSQALRSVFRQSPDVIMVGEMRDLETIQLVLTLAETGHLILATLHTQDATHSINRIVDVFPPAQQQQIYVQLSMVLVGVISQQLVPTIAGDERVLACEVMAVNNAIRNLIREMQIQQIYSVIETGSAEGMVTMNAALATLCKDGVIDEESAMRRAPRPRELARDLQRHR